MRHKFVTALAVLLVQALGVSAAEADSSTDGSDLVEDSAVVTIDQEDFAAAATEGDAASNTATEDRAVEEYLEQLPDDAGAYMAPDDVLVGTVEATDDISAVVVAPQDGADVEQVDVLADASAEEVTAGAAISDADSGDTTTGPGMAGSWPTWSSTTSYVVEIKVYWKKFLNKPANLIGTARFQTQRRQYANDGTAAWDRWHVFRKAVATPDEYEIQAAPDHQAYVKKLWISSQLTAAAQKNAQQWLDSQNEPSGGFSECRSNGEFNAGPFTMPLGDCADYDVWTGAVGHYRFDYDQGTIASGTSKAIAYRSAFQMDNAKYPHMTFYQFATFRMGRTALDGPSIKCAEDGMGSSGTAPLTKCTLQ
ncbi:hypothetical protein JK386_00875 [Nocardioides sp. zg-536]|uniref:Uncharacterized protein n=1 Tax=Nocardioides faecalis TaxID=2803858 RepID=A0A938Y6K7_9ACTN|nr:hypothetical protein [Nocardioides faecalis]MBM9458451.1 hypothetical protein [Nocardioides faecalis]QVI58466.1 hypothetical protein KG111_15965 [Nocardioides faecalis]